jgi:hypothetical protein
MDGNWRTSTMRLDLGTKLVDTRAVRVDKWSYYNMDKANDAADKWSYYNMDKADDAADLFCCEKAWKKATMKEV